MQKAGLKIVALGLGLLMIGVLFAPQADALHLRRLRNLNEMMSTEKGPVSGFGGGNHYFIRFGTNETGMDSVFGVVWGTSEHPNWIHIVMVQARYLGAGDVYDENGKLVAAKHPIKVYTYCGITLRCILEFNDTDGDGLCDYVRGQLGDEQNLTEHETVYNKRVSLRTAWTASNVTTEFNESSKEKSWTFNLTAENLPYRKLRPLQPIDEGAVDQTLERVTFTFHLRARYDEVENVSVPHYNITIGRDALHRYEIKSVHREENLTANGKAARYHVKWDQEIVGWDYNPKNENRALIMEFTANVGNFIPRGTAEWIRENILSKLGERDRATYVTDAGEKTSTENDPIPPRPRLLRANRIDFGGNWSKIGRLTWVSNVTVDGVEKEMHAQIQNGFAYQIAGMGGRVFRGFAVLGGLTYPGGEYIAHDPDVSGEMLLDLQPASTLPIKSSRHFPLLWLGLGVLIAVVVIAALYRMGSKGSMESTYQKQFDTEDEEREPDWEQYYEGR